jgi:hypothetical protein
MSVEGFVTPIPEDPDTDGGISDGLAIVVAWKGSSLQSCRLDWAMDRRPGRS